MRKSQDHIPVQYGEFSKTRKYVFKWWSTTSIKATLTHTVAGTAAYKNHLSCWRSSPRARCSRRMSEKSAARVLNKSSVVPRTVEAEKSRYVGNLPPMTPTTPNGFSTKLWVRNRSGVNASPSAVSRAPKTATHATVRQRRDGSRPFGNNSIRNTPAKTGPANATHVENQATDSPPGHPKPPSRA